MKLYVVLLRLQKVQQLSFSRCVFGSKIKFGALREALGLRGAAGAEQATTAGGVHAVLDHASVQDCLFQGAAAAFVVPGIKSSL